MLLLFLLFIPTLSNAAPSRGTSGDLWADVILGQPDFGEMQPNEVTNRSLYIPQGVAVDRSSSPNRLYVVDDGNNRVLGFSDIDMAVYSDYPLKKKMCLGADITAFPYGADIVLGQSSFVSAGANGDSSVSDYPNEAQPTAYTLCFMPGNTISPTETAWGINPAVDNQGNLYVPDYFNNRVLRYDRSTLRPQLTNKLPNGNGPIAASYVWGQGPDRFNFTAGYRQCGPASASNICFSQAGQLGNSVGVGTDSRGSLWVADMGNNRVLRFPADGSGVPCAVADVVLGQADMTSTTQAANAGDASHLYGPTAVRVDDSGNVYVMDWAPNTANGGHGRMNVYRPTGTDAGGLYTYNPSGAANLVTQNYLCNASSLEFDPDPQEGGLWMMEGSQAVLFDIFNAGNPFTPKKVLFRSQPWIGTGPQPTTSVGSGAPFRYVYPSAPVSQNYSLNGFMGIAVDGNHNVFISSGKAGSYMTVWRFPDPPLLGTLAAGMAWSADVDVFKRPRLGMQNFGTMRGVEDPKGVAVASASATSPAQVIVANATGLMYWNMPSGAQGLSTFQGADGIAQANTQNQDGYVFPILGNYFGRIREDKAMPQQHLWALHGNIEAYNLPLNASSTPIVTLPTAVSLRGGGSVSLNGRVDGICPDPNSPTGQYLWVAHTWGSRVMRIRDPLTNPVVDVILGQASAGATLCNRGNGANCSNISLCVPGSVRLDRRGNLYVSDFSLESDGNWRLLRWNADTIAGAVASASTAVCGLPADEVYGHDHNMNSGYQSCLSGVNPFTGVPDPSFQVCNPYEPAFPSDDRVMVAPEGYYGGGSRQPIVFQDPYLSPLGDNDWPVTHLMDFTSMAYSSDFDDEDNLFIADGNRNWVILYLNPFSSPFPTLVPTPATLTPIVTPSPGAFTRSLNVGGLQYVSASTGITWLADQAYSPGGFGCVVCGNVCSYSTPVTGTQDSTLYQTMRCYSSLTTLQFQFDNLPWGEYQVALKFMEAECGIGAGSRVMNITANGATVVQNLDINATVGCFNALDRVFNVAVTNGSGGYGSLDLRFIPTGSRPPVISAIRVVEYQRFATPTPTPTGTWETPTPTITPTRSWTRTSTPSITPTFTITYTRTSVPTPTLTPFSLFNCPGTFFSVTEPYGLAVNSGGTTLYVADNANHQVGVYDAGGAAITQWGSAYLSSPNGVAIDPAGTLLFVTDDDNDQVVVFNASTGQVTGQWDGYGGDDFLEPYGIAVNASGTTVYVADWGSGEVDLFSPQGVPLAQWTALVSGGLPLAPTGIAVGPGGEVYVTDYGAKLVQVFNGLGVTVRQWSTDDLVGADFIALDASGGATLVYVSDGLGSVGVYGPNGERLGVTNGWGLPFEYTEGVAAQGGVWYAADYGADKVYKFAGCTPTPISTPVSLATATRTITPHPSLPLPLYLAVGGAATYVSASSGITWLPDHIYPTGGFGCSICGNVCTYTTPVAGTQDSALYQNMRCYSSLITLQFQFDNLPWGDYQVVLKFMEAECLSGRVMNITANGATVIQNLNLYGTVGCFAALDSTFNVAVTNGAGGYGSLDLRFIPTGSRPPVISAIQIIPLSAATPTPSFTASSTPPPTPTVSPTPSPTPSASPSATATSTTTVTNTMTVSMTPTASPTATTTVTNTTTVSPAPTGTSTATPTPTNSTTASLTVTSTGSLTPTVMNTVTITPSSTPTSTETPSWTPSVSATRTSSPTPTASPTVTYTVTVTPTFTSTATATASDTPTYSPTLTPTASASPTFTFTLTPTSTPTPGIGLLYPNPVKDGNGTGFDYSLPGPSELKLAVYTVAFRKVFEESRPVDGSGTVHWDLKDSWGTPLANGLYYLVIDSSQGRTIKKLIILQ